MQSLIIHGRQPGLARAELESLYESALLTTVGSIATLIDKDPSEIDFMRLGGMVKFCKVLTILHTTNWDPIEKFLLETTPQHFKFVPDGKLRIGISVYDLIASPNRIQSTALKIKRLGKTSGRSIRIIPNREQTLNSATVLYNKLTQSLGWELIFVRYGNKTIVAQSIAVQDIDDYAARDQKRPMRDARVGMLPPKLAQTIINLAVDKNETKTVLDPFCGTGVILQESLLMGYVALGSDLEPRMVDYTEKNLVWLNSDYKIPACGLPNSKDKKLPEFSVEVGDATKHTWAQRFDAIACETYLGRPLTTLPDSQTLQKIVLDCDVIHKKFLQNIARQTKSGFRMCIAVPAWSVTKSFIHLPTLDKLANLGYNRVKFANSSESDLIYHRPGQVVGRELVVLTRK